MMKNKLLQLLATKYFAEKEEMEKRIQYGKIN